MLLGSVQHAKALEMGVDAASIVGEQRRLAEYQWTRAWKFDADVLDH